MNIIGMADAVDVLASLADSVTDSIRSAKRKSSGSSARSSKHHMAVFGLAALAAATVSLTLPVVDTPAVVVVETRRSPESPPRTHTTNARAAMLASLNRLRAQGIPVDDRVRAASENLLNWKTNPRPWNSIVETEDD